MVMKAAVKGFGLVSVVVDGAGRSVCMKGNVYIGVERVLLWIHKGFLRYVFHSDL